MRKVFLALGVAAIALASPGLAQGRGQGQGQGQGQGKDKASAERGRGGGNERAQGAARRGGGPEGKARAGREARQAEARQAEAREPRGRGRAAADRAAADRAAGPSRRAEDRGERRLADRGRGRAERRAVVVTDRGAIARLRHQPRLALVRGCPPGLARKHNGCLPPGQARRLAAQRAWYGNWWRSPSEGLYRYDGGYLWRLQPNGTVAGFVPLAGGALWLGNRWPDNYASYPVPDYYADYYGYDDPYSYRYADGVVYGLDPRTQTIRRIAGLVTGDEWAIGGRMPDGYGVYNVPYDYRDEYYDTPEYQYRYSDGYVYRVDPMTQLIQAVIQLIA